MVAWLANQMSQYALGRAISLERKDTLYLDTDPFYYDTREYELGIFDIEEYIATSKQKPWYLILRKNKFLDKVWYVIAFLGKKINPFHIIENPRHPLQHRRMFDYNPHAVNKAIHTKHHIYLEWFRHSEKYFKKYEDVIRKDFTLKKSIDDETNKVLLKKMNAATASVSIHVRRGDYAGTYYEWICDLDYYKRAIAYMEAHLENSLFFVLSDDVERCKEQFKDFIIEDYCENWWNPRQKNSSIPWTGKHGADAYKNMILMANCKHNIIANSTFSRWGARLNANPDKIVIAPKKRHANIDYNDIIPVTRIRI